MAWNWILRRSTARPGTAATRIAPTKQRPRRAALNQVEVLEERLVLTPTAEEQLFVYLLNQIRHDPVQYGNDIGLNLDNVAPRQPLAVNASLFDSAQLHAVEMAENNYFDHRSHVTNKWPNQLAVDAGYALPDYFQLNANYIESIAAGNLYSDPADVIELLIRDDGEPTLGHRNHLLGIDDFNAQASEIGVGHGFDLSSLYDHYWAAHITFSDPGDMFLTGVVYDDTNGDHQYSLGEGLSGVNVAIPGLGPVTQTNAQGGWSLRVPGAGNYTVSVSGGLFEGSASNTVAVTTLNREIDFISGNSTGVVDFAVQPSAPNEAPVNTVPAGPLNIQEDVAFSITGISIADSDAANHNVSVTLSVDHGKLRIDTSVTGGVTSSQVTGNNSDEVVLTAPLAKINATLADAQGLVYTGLADFNGADTLTVLTDDLGSFGTGGALTDTDTVDLTVAAVNDAPVNTVPNGTLAVITETTLDVTGLGVSDVDIDTASGQFNLTVLHGTLTLRTDVVGGLTPADVASNGTNAVTVTAPLSRLQPTLQAQGGVTYISDVAYIGPETLTVSSSDLGNAGSGGAGTDQDSVSINVQPVPIPPTVTVPAEDFNTPIEKSVVISSGATISDPDSANFSGGKLVISITAGVQATDVLTINTVGKKSGQLNVKKNKIRLGKDEIGELSGGENGAPLQVRFTSSVTLSTVQTVLQNVELRASKKKLLTGTRTIQFVATDPTQTSSTPHTRNVNVTL